MDSKNVKNYLPNTYEQYLTLKKKQNKGTQNQIKTSLANFFQQTKPQQSKPSKIQQSSDDDNIKQQQIQQKLIHSDYQQMFTQFNNSKFNQIKNKIQSEIMKLRTTQLIEMVTVNNILKKFSIQSFENINKLQLQFKQPLGKRNIDAIDSMLYFNKFFVILNRDKRYKIYDNAFFFTVQEGQVVYQQGDTDDYMFIVVKGCIKQFQKRSTSFNQKVTVNFLTHYQGSNFGESLLLNDQIKAKRYHSTVASEKSYLLRIENNFYRDLITNSKQDDFQKKLSSLLSTSIFKDTSKIFVMPLVSTIEKIQLEYGKVLIRQGETVKKLYFIASGNLQVIYLDRAKRTIKHLNIQEKPQNFYLKKRQAKQKNKNYSIHNSFYYPKSKENGKEFIYGGKEIHGDELEYNDHIVFTELRIGDFLGGKSFLAENQIQKKHSENELFHLELQSKLTVVSSSILTVVYALDEKKFFSLSDNLQRVIIQGILAQPYFDQQNIHAKVQDQKQWKNYSQKLVQKIIKGKKLRQHSFRN